MLADLFDLVLPRTCPGCGRCGVSLCAACGAPAPLPVDVPGLRVIAGAPYQGGVRAALIGYKERGRRDLGPPLGRLLAAALTALALDATTTGADRGLDPPAATALVPVPSSAAARRARGGDHVVRLARAARSPGQRVLPVLAQSRAVLDSAGLGIAGRAANLDHAMCAGAPGARDRRVVIVDDITTTGATLGEAARALRAAGWVVSGAAVVAATPLRQPRSGRSVPIGDGQVTHG